LLILNTRTATPITGVHFVDLCICRPVYLNALLSLADM